MTRKEICNYLDTVWAQVESAHAKLAELIPKADNKALKEKLGDLSLELKENANEIADLSDNVDKGREP